MSKSIEKVYISSFKDISKTTYPRNTDKNLLLYQNSRPKHYAITSRTWERHIPTSPRSPVWSNRTPANMTRANFEP